MGKHRATGPSRRAAGSVVAAGAIPLIATLIGAGTANAEALPAPPASSPIPAALPALPPAPIATVDPFGAATDAVQEAARVVVRSATDTITAATAPFTHTAPAVPAVLRPAVIADQVAPAPALATRPVPNHAYLAPQGELHAPTPVAPVAPIEAPPGKLRIGNVEMDAPFDVRDINTGAAQTEAQLATFLDSVGIERSRSDRIAAQTLGSAAIGASVANTLASPLAGTSAVVGAVAGFISGIPFLPIGLVIGPVLGAAIGYAVIAAPAVAAGAAIGGAVGAADGFAATPYGTPPAQ
ncbi:hypothetical protein AB0H42_12240 [Nocardia sp. NPDC050799]|uniref:hypothetical protein n=1 Tax=Nocardia sp. NPDC050799 TaxID=3154842 RepID=UPI0033CB65F1